jgi:uncharacterized protein (DUF427 family)
MGQRSSAYSKYPDYRVDLQPGPRGVRVVFNGETIADSKRSLLVRETAHEPVYYFPREDVRLDLMERTDHQTFCPFKGEASYWTLRAGDQKADNAAWSYEDPFAEVAGLANYVSFYGDVVEHQADVES